MADDTDTVRAYYDLDPEREWTRLVRHPFEFAVTLALLKRYLVAHSKILDVGSGPGRYAIELTRLGHSVEIMDLSPRSIEFAVRKAADCAVHLLGSHVGNATDLGSFPQDSFDAVLLLGPMYHLVDPTDRERTIREALRVLRARGLLAAAFLSSYAGVYDLLNKNPSLILEDADQLLRCRKTDVFLSLRDKVFTDAWYVEPGDIEPFMDQFPIRRLCMFGAEGLVGQSQALIVSLGDAVLQEWIRNSIELADTQGAINSSIHVVYLGRKAE